MEKNSNLMIGVLIGLIAGGVIVFAYFTLQGRDSKVPNVLKVTCNTDAQQYARAQSVYWQGQGNPDGTDRNNITFSVATYSELPTQLQAKIPKSRYQGTFYNLAIHKCYAFLWAYHQPNDGSYSVFQLVDITDKNMVDGINLDVGGWATSTASEMTNNFVSNYYAYFSSK